MIYQGWLLAAGLAVFVIVNPMIRVEGRVWQEIVFLYAGFAAGLVALLGATPLVLLPLWLLVQAAVYEQPIELMAVLALLAWAGIAGLALRSKAGAAAGVVRWIVAVNVLVMLLQATGAWTWFWPHLASGFTMTILNPLHPVTGLTSSTGDVACVLAMGLPFCFAGRWAFLGAAGVFALLSTSALSGIVAGLAGLLVLAWPWLRRQASPAVLVPAGLFIGSTFFAAGWSEISGAWTDERWQMWSSARTLCATDFPAALFGRGLGAWEAAVFASPQGVWGSLHFDALQLWYDAGAVGLALAVGAWIWCWARASAAGNRGAMGALVAVAVAQFGHFPFHLAAPLVVTALIAGDAAHGEAP